MYPKALAFGSGETLLYPRSNILWRAFHRDVGNLGPWHGHQSFIAVSAVGNFIRASSEAPYATDSSSSIIWWPLVPDDWEPVQRNVTPGEIRPVSITSSFHLDSSFKQFLANIRVANPYLHNIEIVLIAPSGKEHPVEMDWTNHGLIGSATARIDLDPSSLGAWRIECRGVSYNEAQMTYRIIGVSRGLRSEDDEMSGISTTRPYRRAIVTSLRAHLSDVQGELLVVSTTHDGDYILTNLSVTVTARLPDGSIDRVAMNDNRGDGFYTGTLNLRPNLKGDIVLTAKVSNPDGTATHRNNPMLLASPRQQPLEREPITEFFQRLTQTVFWHW